MILCHKIELCPTVKHCIAFAKACGVARYSYNWGLDQWNEGSGAGQTHETVVVEAVTKPCSLVSTY